MGTHEESSGRVVQWPHAPPHRLEVQGSYFVTAGTYLKQHIFREPAALDLLHDALLSHAHDHGWQLEAWAVFANHYHFVGRSTRDGARGSSLGIMLARLHKATASAVNAMYDCRGRKVWHRYRDTLLTFEKSWMARLNYTHQNPVRHGLVRDARDYPWCSAGWFERTASVSWQRTVASFKTDRLHVDDAY